MFSLSILQNLVQAHQANLESTNMYLWVGIIALYCGIQGIVMCICQKFYNGALLLAFGSVAIFVAGMVGFFDFKSEEVSFKIEVAQACDDVIANMNHESYLALDRSSSDLLAEHCDKSALIEMDKKAKLNGK